MIRFLSHILRFIIIAIGYLLAVVAASAFVLMLGWGGLIGPDPDQGKLVAFAVTLSIPVMAVFAGYYSFLPAVAFAVIAEIWGKRSWLFHAIGGMAVTAVAMAARPEELTRPGLFMIALAAGAVGGTVYWLIAGRNAGKHLDEARVSAASSGS